MYRVHKTDLVLLRSRGKAHKIISHAIEEDLMWNGQTSIENSHVTMDPQEAGSRQV